MTAKQTIVELLVTEKRAPTPAEAKILASSTFELGVGNFQIKEHSDEVKAKMNDPQKIYPTSWIEAKVAVKITKDTPKDDDGNRIITLKGSVFKAVEGAPPFVLRTGNLVDVNLIPTKN